MKKTISKNKFDNETNAIPHGKSAVIFRKIIAIVIGSVVSAYGITLALYAGFGGATLAVLWQGVSETCSVSIGAASFLVALAMILFVFFYDKTQLQIGTVLYQIIYSACVDLFADCHLYSDFAWMNFLIMILGVILFAAGTGLYASASLGRGSYEALTFALAERNHWQIKIVRMTLDFLIVVLGVCLGGTFGPCTVITVLLSGPIIQRVNDIARKIFHF